MKTFRITEPGQTDFVEIPVPGAGPGEVLLGIKTVGYCGSDLSTFRGANPLVSYPRVPGHEIGAVIVDVGQGVPDRWQSGMQVLVSPYTRCGSCSACRQGRFNCCRYNETMGVQRDGAMTEFVAVPHESLFTASLSLSEMALVEPLTVGFHAVDRGAVRADETVVVFGCGAIGLGAIAGAAARDARVIAVDIDDRKLDLAAACGAGEGINSAGIDLHDALQALTDGEGPEVSIEAVGLPSTFRAAVDEVCFAGRVVYIGYAKAPVEYETRYFVQRELDIRGSRNALPADFDAVIRYLEGGGFPVDRVISRVVPFDEAGGALTSWNDAPGEIARIHVQIA